ncbi:MAG: hypothetical protein P8Z30_15750 [Acidobacteriota bacterium]
MEVIDEIVKCMVEALQDERSASSTETEQLRRRKGTIESERNNLIDTIAGGFNNEIVKVAILEREKEIDEINLKLDMAEGKACLPDLKQLRNFAISKLPDLRDILGKPDNVPAFRHMLENRVGVIQMEPAEDDGTAC